MPDMRKGNRYPQDEKRQEILRMREWNGVQFHVLEPSGGDSLRKVRVTDGGKRKQTALHQRILRPHDGQNGKWLKISKNSVKCLTISYIFRLKSGNR